MTDAARLVVGWSMLSLFSFFQLAILCDQIANIWSMLFQKFGCPNLLIERKITN